MANAQLANTKLDFKQGNTIISTLDVSPVTLTGTVSMSSGTKILNGINTAFLSELSVGLKIQIGSDELQIASISTDTDAVTTSNATATHSGASFTKTTARFSKGSNAVFLELSDTCSRFKLGATPAEGSVLMATDTQGTLSWSPQIPQVHSFGDLTRPNGTALTVDAMRDLFVTSFGGTKSDSSTVTSATATDFRNTITASNAVMAVVNSCTRGATGSRVWELFVSTAGDDLGGFIPSQNGILKITNKPTYNLTLLCQYAMDGSQYVASYDGSSFHAWVQTNARYELHTYGNGNQQHTLEFPKYASGLWMATYRDTSTNSIMHTGSWATDSQAVRMKVFTIQHRGAGNQRLIVNQNGAAASGSISTTSGLPTVSGNSTLFTSEFQPGDHILIGKEVYEVLQINSNTSMNLTQQVRTTNNSLAPYYLYGGGSNRTITISTSGVGGSNDNDLLFMYTDISCRNQNYKFNV